MASGRNSNRSPLTGYVGRSDLEWDPDTSTSCHVRTVSLAVRAHSLAKIAALARMS